MPLINRLCGVDLTFVQGRVGRVEVHQAADVSLVAEIGRRLVLPGLRGGVCGGGNQQGRLNQRWQKYPRSLLAQILGLKKRLK